MTVAVSGATFGTNKKTTKKCEDLLAFFVIRQFHRQHSCNKLLKIASIYKPLQQECHKIGKGVELAIETDVLISQLYSISNIIHIIPI